MLVPSLNEFESHFRDAVWLDIADAICSKHQIGFKSLRRAEHGENIVIFVDDELVLKIYTPKKNGYRRERNALEFIKGKVHLPIPEVVAAGSFEGFNYLIMDQMSGCPLRRDEWMNVDRPQQTQLLTQLAIGLRELHSLDAGEIDFDWREFIRIQTESVMDRQRVEGGNPEWMESLPAYLKTHLPLVPTRPVRNSFMHGDVHFGNVRINKEPNGLKISGIFDFADSLKGFHEYEFVAIGVLMIQGQGELQREFFRAYGYREDEINEEMRRRLMLLTILYEHSSLRRYAERLGPGSEKLSLEELEKAIWNFV